MSVATCVNQRINNGIGLVWERIERTLGYQVDPKQTRFRNYNIFVKDLVATIDSYPKAEVPKDIRKILGLAKEKAPTVAQACKLQEFVRCKRSMDTLATINSYPETQIPADIREIVDQAIEEKEVLRDEQMSKLHEFMSARDTLVVWLMVAVQAQIDVDLVKIFGCSESAIEQAKGFAEWMEENHEKLDALHFLDLSANQLTSIPKELGRLKCLRELVLSENQIRSIPQQLEELTNLQVLNLSNNQLMLIPKVLGDLKELCNLNFRGNQLMAVPKELGKLENLKHLNLHSNQLKSVPKELKELRNLILLLLTENQITSIPEEIKALPNLMVFFSQIGSNRSGKE